MQERAMDVLKGVLQDQDHRPSATNLKLWALRTLENMKEKGLPLKKEVEKLLLDTDLRVRLGAMATLTKMTKNVVEDFEKRSSA